MRAQGLLPLLAIWVCTFSFSVNAAVNNLDELLEQVKSGNAIDAKDNIVRIKAFEAEKAAQTEKLSAMERQQKQLEKRSALLESEFEENEKQLLVLEAKLRDRLGNLNELYGILQQVTGDTRAQFENSLTQVQFPQRDVFLTRLLDKMGQPGKLTSIKEIKRLWFELQREITESAKLVRFKTEVITSLGEKEMRVVTRVGLFNVVSQGKYLTYVPETGNLVELARQPAGKYLAGVEDFEQSTGGFTGLAIDPSRGQLLSLIVQSPDLFERISQGGVVGYIILMLGFIALLIATERLFTLWFTGVHVKQQVKNSAKPILNNPLGRVLAIYDKNNRANTETLELKLSEAVLKETLNLNRSLVLLKVIAVVAPLMGLLGTVIGMIVTFQAITLFGTGDPKLMAGGISQALVTTVLGLCVAIPTVFLHTLVASRSKHIAHILEEQAMGMVAERSEHEAT